MEGLGAFIALYLWPCPGLAKCFDLLEPCFVFRAFKLNVAFWIAWRLRFIAGEEAFNPRRRFLGALFDFTLREEERSFLVLAPSQHSAGEGVRIT